MPEPRTVTVYIDYKSPYAYLAKDCGSEAGRRRQVLQQDRG